MQLDTENLRTLLRELKEGSEPAFKMIYSAYSEQLYQKVRRIVKYDLVADEILQDLFLRLWENRTKIDIELPLMPYLYTIAKNLVYDYFRKVAKDNKLQEELLLQAVDYYRYIEEDIHHRELKALLEKGLLLLPEQRRKVFTLCKVKGYSYQEAAEILGISVATINAHMVQALRQIKEFLDKNREVSLLLIIELLLH